jgi:hypothetical protein
MDTTPRYRRFFKETQNASSNIVYNPLFENMLVMPNVTITLPTHYPFQHPILKIYNKNYISYFIKLFDKYKSFIHLHNLNIHCICCKSVICDWTPCWGMKEVINECKEYGYKIGLISKCKWVLDKLNFDDLVCSIIVNYLI